MHLNGESIYISIVLLLTETVWVQLDRVHRSEGKTQEEDFDSCPESYLAQRL